MTETNEGTTETTPVAKPEQTWVDKANEFLDIKHDPRGQVAVHHMVAMVNGLLAEMNCRAAGPVETEANADA